MRSALLAAKTDRAGQPRDFQGCVGWDFTTGTLSVSALFIPARSHSQLSTRAALHVVSAKTAVSTGCGEGPAMDRFNTL